MSVRDANRRRRWRPCLKCGRMMHTDRCHRICKRCKAENEFLARSDTLRIVRTAVIADSDSSEEPWAFSDR